jgi:hypothetical protein
MRLFIAREALDAHAQRIFPLLDPKVSLPEKIKKAFPMAAHYALWYPHQWIYGKSLPEGIAVPRKLTGHFRYLEEAAHRLARNLFHGMMLYQQGLEKKQQLLTRLVNIGTDLFAMAAASSRAVAVHSKNPADAGPIELADLFCRQARTRVEKRFGSLFCNDDRFTYEVAQETLKGKYRWLEEGIIEP